MRYTIVILLLVLSGPAVSGQCLTTYRKLDIEADCGLPDSIAAYSTAGCSVFKWSFHFSRTEKTAGWATIFIRFAGTDSFEWFYSDSYAPGRYHLEFSGQVFDRESSVEIILMGGSCGYFEDMEIEIYDHR